MALIPSSPPRPNAVREAPPGMLPGAADGTVRRRSPGPAAVRHATASRVPTSALATRTHHWPGSPIDDLPSTIRREAGRLRDAPVTAIPGRSAQPTPPAPDQESPRRAGAAKIVRGTLFASHTPDHADPLPLVLAMPASATLLPARPPWPRNPRPLRHPTAPDREPAVGRQPRLHLPDRPRPVEHFDSQGTASLPVGLGMNSSALAGTRVHVMAVVADPLGNWAPKASTNGLQGEVTEPPLVFLGGDTSLVGQVKRSPHLEARTWGIARAEPCMARRRTSLTTAARSTRRPAARGVAGRPPAPPASPLPAPRRRRPARRR